MAQFYLLSVVANFIAGITLASEYVMRRLPAFPGLGRFRTSRGAEIALGVVTAVVGVLKLVFRSPGEDIPVAGDLLPGIVGIALGAVLYIDANRKEAEAIDESTTVAKPTLLSYRVPIGIAGAVVALLHFVIPGVVIL